MRPAIERFIKAAPAYKDPVEVLDALGAVSSRHPQRLKVMGTWQLPRRHYFLEKDRLGRNLFYHPDFPGEQFWDAYRQAAIANGESPLSDYTRLHSAPFTITEATRALQLTGRMRWVIDLTREYRIRDALYCPFRRWVVVYYLDNPLKLERSERHLLGMAACIAVEQIERILVKGPRPMRPPHLTEREDAVLRLRSKGYNVPEIAEYLGLSVATVRVHVRKLVAKLEAKDLTHAVAIAFRTGILI